MRKTKYSKFKCIDGPYNGLELLLSDGATAVFRVAGWHGYYFRSSYSNVKWVNK